MVRPYAGVSGTHMAFGVLCMAAGVAWVCLLQFYEDVFVEGPAPSVLPKMPLWETVPAWVSVILSAKIICGFWFFITGAIGCCIKSRGCTEGVFVALSVLNAIVWAPVLLLVVAAMVYILVVDPALLKDAHDFTALQKVFNEYMWLYVFFAVGGLVGIVEFLLSVVSYSMVCCCRPSSLNDGYDYEMK